MLGRTLSITITTALALAIFGCSLGDSPTAPQTQAPAAATNSLLGSLTGSLTNAVSSLLLSCDKLPAQSVSQVIGKDGGQIKVGPHLLVIPSGALQSDVRISAELPGDKVSSVRLLPEGLRFSKPATLTLSYAHCRKLLPLPTRIVYTTDNLNILQLLRSLDYSSTKKVSAPLNHFSRYAVAYLNPEAEEEAGLTERDEEQY